MTREEWLRHRKTGIGGSDAAAIMGVSPYMTALQLYEEKISDDISEEESYIMDRGNEFETKLRAYWEFTTGETYKAALLVNEEFPFLRVSLDGRTQDAKRIAEMKLLGLQDWTALKEKGIVPKQYVPQIQHNLMVSKAESCALLGYLFKKDEPRNAPIDPERLIAYKVFPDQSYIENLFVEEVKFWEQHVLKRVPPLPSARDYKKITTKGATGLAHRYYYLKKKIEKLEEEREMVKEHLLGIADMMNHPRLCAGELRFLKISKKGNVDYSKVPQLEGVDLDKYRKNGSTYWKIEEVEK